MAKLYVCATVLTFRKFCTSAFSLKLKQKKIMDVCFVDYFS